MADNAPPEKLGGNIGMPQITPGMNKKPDTPSASDGQKKKETEENVKVHDRAKRRFDRCYTADNNNRKLGLEDDKFYNNQQWPEDMAAQRNFDHRPCLTFNYFPTLLHQITNDFRQNRPAINVSPVGDKGDPEAAKMYMGIIRHIQRESRSDIAYDTAFESKTRKGFGYWRVLTEYEAPDSFDQAIRIQRIRNAFSVYMDPNAQEPNGSDSRYSFITDFMPRDDFRDEYPDADPMNWTLAGVGDQLKNWIAEKEVRIAEYFEVRNNNKTLVMLNNGHQGWKDEIDAKILGRVGVAAERETIVPEVWWYKLSGVEVLDEKLWPGVHIPIVRDIGDEIEVEGKVYFSGIIRNAKDAQRQYNYTRTALVEKVALSPKATYLMAAGQQEGHEEAWKNANNRSFPFLLYNQNDLYDKQAPPPIPVPAAPIPAGLVESIKEATTDLMGTTGVRFNSTPQERMYDESGRALRELRRSGDIGSFHLTDNHAHALQHTGDILVDLIPKIYDRKRVTTILREDNSEQLIEINPGAQQALSQGKHPQTGKQMPIFNPTVGKYGVTVTIGPSYATKRIEASESMMDFLRAVGVANPQMAMAIAPLIAKNQDWPEADQLYTMLLKMLPPNLQTVDQKDMPPQAQAIIQSMTQQLRQMMAERQQMVKMLTDTQADRAQRQSKIDNDFEAKLLTIVQKAESQYQTHVGSQLKDLGQGVKLLHDELSGMNGEDLHG